MMLPTLQSPYLLNYSSQGEMRFSANVRQVLESYVISRGILTGVLFKCGGTLLYSDEARIFFLKYAYQCFIQDLHARRESINRGGERGDIIII